MDFYGFIVLGINLLSVILIVLTLVIQFKLRYKYNDNGYVNHRYAFITGNIGLLLSVVMRIFLFIRYEHYITMTLTWIEYSLVILFNIIIFMMCMIQYFWFKGSNFEIFNYIRRKK